MLDVRRHLARIRKNKASERRLWNEKSDGEKKEILDKRDAPDTLKVSLQKMIWDYNHLQLHIDKFSLFKKMIKERIKEIKNPWEQKELTKLKLLEEKLNV